MKRLAILLLLTFTSTASAKWPFDCCCEIVNMLGDQGPGGSGALVGTGNKSSLVVSCAHVFTDPDMRRKEIGDVTVKFPKAGKFRARVLAVDIEHDLSALEIPIVKDLRPIPIRKISKQDGPFTAAGYPAKIGFSHYSGAFVGLSGFEAIISHRSYSGYSGGPLLNNYGEQVGVVVRTGPNSSPSYTVTVSGDVLVNFVRRWVKQ